MMRCILFFWNLELKVLGVIQFQNMGELFQILTYYYSFSSLSVQLIAFFIWANYNHIPPTFL